MLEMFKPVNWKTLPRDILRIQLGFALYGLAIALMIQANLGTGPWAVLAVALADLAGTSPGTMVILSGLVVLAGAMALKEPVGWGTVGNILFVGPWLDLFLLFLPDVKDQLLLQLGMLLIGIGFVGLASAVYIGVDAGAGPRDSLMLAVTRVSGWSLRLARSLIEVVVVIIGWLLGGPAGVGTLLFAILVGPAVQLNFRLLGVKTEGS